MVAKDHLALMANQAALDPMDHLDLEDLQEEMESLALLAPPERTVPLVAKVPTDHLVMLDPQDHLARLVARVTMASLVHKVHQDHRVAKLTTAQMALLAKMAHQDHQVHQEKMHNTVPVRHDLAEPKFSEAENQPTPLIDRKTALLMFFCLLFVSRKKQQLQS
jgi:hypothetical protein